MPKSWVMAKLIGGPADGKYVRVYSGQEIYRMAVHVETTPAEAFGESMDLGYMVLKYRYSGLSKTELDGSIPIMLYGFIRLERPDK